MNVFFLLAFRRARKMQFELEDRFFFFYVWKLVKYLNMLIEFEV